jgi:hypothetical protein
MVRGQEGTQGQRLSCGGGEGGTDIGRSGIAALEGAADGYLLAP